MENISFRSIATLKEETPPSKEINAETYLRQTANFSFLMEDWFVSDSTHFKIPKEPFV